MTNSKLDMDKLNQDFEFVIDRAETDEETAFSDTIKNVRGSNCKKNYGEHFRVFPLSNWTEMDVWQYIEREEIEMPVLYFSHKRRVFNRDGVWLAESPYNPMKPTEVVVEKQVRFRTIGDITCTGAIESEVDKLEDIIAEVAAFRVTERAGRHDDKRTDTAMEDRKKEGYF